MNATTPEDERAFGRCLRKWQALLGLVDWRIVPLKGKASGAMAEVTCNLESRLATYRFGKSFGDAAITPRSIESTAVHELAHVLLHELVETAKNPHASAEAIMSAEHRVIHTIERLLVPPDDPDLPS